MTSSAPAADAGAVLRSARPAVYQGVGLGADTRE
jgi:hypothetical protein